MDKDFWHAMWSSGRVGFHQSEINTFLKSHWDILELNNYGEVLVPLCGKSLDMLWLKQMGHEVIGIELSQKALDEFVEENDLMDTAVITHDHYCGYQLKDMTLLCGDFFHLSSLDCQKVVAVYDRAALIAFPEDMRSRYASHLKKIVPQATKIFLVAMEYDQSLTQGPPFSVEEAEIRLLYGDHFKIDCLNTIQFERKGIATTEKVYLLEPL